MSFSTSKREAFAMQQLLVQMEDPILKKVIEYGSRVAQLYFSNNTSKTVSKRHKKTIVMTPFMTADIDRNIAPLIEQIWTAGIMTMKSCENNIPEDYVWIQFPTIEYFKKFLGYVEYDLLQETPIYSRMMGLAEPRWLYNFHLQETNDRSLSGRSEACTCYRASVRFPHCDLKEVYDRLKSWNYYFDENPSARRYNDD